MNTEINNPPPNTLRVEAWRDLPSNKGWMTYRVTAQDGSAHKIKVRKNNRRILEAIMNGPVLAASAVRISDNIHILKRDYGVTIKTEMYENDTATDRAKFGVYFLVDSVVAVSTDGGA